MSCFIEKNANSRNIGPGSDRIEELQRMPSIDSVMEYIAHDFELILLSIDSVVGNELYSE